MVDRPEITADLVLMAYERGIFPMAEHRDAEIFWVDPKKRGILPLDRLHISRSLRKRILRGGFTVTVDTAFVQVMHHCADREDTWISDEIIGLYTDLHHRGYASSVEVWATDGQLIGGLYGVRIGAAFFGESMFSKQADTSKIALVWLVARLRSGGYQLCDTQFVTDHLLTLGAVEISRLTYHKKLAAALKAPGYWSALPSDTPSDVVIQLSTQTSYRG